MEPMNLKTVVAQDFFSEEHYKSIYNTINLQIEKNLAAGKGKYEDGFEIVNNNGFVVFFDNFSQDVLKAIKDRLGEIIGVPVLRPGVLFARYTRDSGYRPRLRPHADRAVKKPSVTATIELDTTLDWDIYVNDDGFNLKKNEILVFSGSRDVHWRPDIDFTDEDYFDVIILQTSMDIQDNTVLDDAYFNEMDKVSGQFIEKYRHLLEKSLNDESQRV
jgi:hypothetical protein